MPPKHTAPSVHLRSFSCPHCGALAAQGWFKAFVSRTSDGETPWIIDQDILKRLSETIDESLDREHRTVMEDLHSRAQRLVLGQPFIHDLKNDGVYCRAELANIFVSLCYSCKEIGIWRHEALIYPPHRHEVEPNADLDDEIRATFDEARSVFEASPRAAAALLRLCIQMLCKQVGLKGKKIDDDIRDLVAAGLPVRIQQALDLVRVIGNNAVHPGQLNLNDDRTTAMKLFELVNMVADHQISQPKAIAALFAEKVPEGAKAAIARRDGGATGEAE